ncbi:hypothetical protein [Streptomyces fuscichromogenes]|uniref:Uncharacterized protein n=1 Tax=Streptomyces fuscichromogenes TaxID=1324013 RepID=A0A917XG02_9ACTN|nr:hypothetical protein [Streptomyces fuscichromogenes]GGN22160.1 hypothetical protein GCM10011578_053770 [Streptomyces fuscichromogenes]
MEHVLVARANRLPSASNGRWSWSAYRRSVALLGGGTVPVCRRRFIACPSHCVKTPVISRTLPVSACAVHEQVVRHEIVTGLPAEELWPAGGTVFGIRATGHLRGRSAVW